MATCPLSPPNERDAKTRPPHLVPVRDDRDLLEGPKRWISSLRWHLADPPLEALWNHPERPAPSVHGELP